MEHESQQAGLRHKLGRKHLAQVNNYANVELICRIAKAEKVDAVWPGGATRVATLPRRLGACQREPEAAGEASGDVHQLCGAHIAGDAPLPRVKGGGERPAKGSFEVGLGG